eukprot:TRINITY_DN6520_c0_g1_i3.p1 TRINITY_DN6520_c0_g1~~TRINITY_DN6520_c0_g1_i3.p1  ORF type:complete len:501 (+),score=144.37 TRINITY_DN6520_c0_g1_i3:93-1595(+)
MADLKTDAPPPTATTPAAPSSPKKKATSIDYGLNHSPRGRQTIDDTSSSSSAAAQELKKARSRTGEGKFRRISEPPIPMLFDLEQHKAKFHEFCDFLQKAQPSQPEDVVSIVSRKSTIDITPIADVLEEDEKELMVVAEAMTDAVATAESTRMNSLDSLDGSFRGTREQVQEFSDLATSDLSHAIELHDDAGAKMRLSSLSKKRPEYGVVITDPNQTITYFNSTFSKATGYAPEEILGRNCRFLQGDDTDPKTIQEMTEALIEKKSVNVQLLNYRKDGTPLWNFLQISPLFDRQGNVISYVGIQIFDSAKYVDPSMEVFPWISKETLQSQKDAGIVTSPGGGSPRLRITNGDDDDDEDDDAKSAQTGSAKEKHYSFIAETNLPTLHGTFKVRAYREHESKTEPMAIISGNVRGLEEVTMRVHDQCFTSEVLGSLKCDCREQLQHAMEYIRDNSPGIVIYLQQEGRGMGLANKIKAYSIQEVSSQTLSTYQFIFFSSLQIC